MPPVASRVTSRNFNGGRRPRSPCPRERSEPSECASLLALWRAGARRTKKKAVAAAQATLAPSPRRPHSTPHHPASAVRGAFPPGHASRSGPPGPPARSCSARADHRYPGKGARACASPLRETPRPGCGLEVTRNEGVVFAAGRGRRSDPRCCKGRLDAVTRRSRGSVYPRNGHGRACK